MLKKLVIGTLLITSSIAFASNTEKFLSVADIHFDPFSGCHIVSFEPCPLVAKLRAAPAQDWEKIFENNDSKKPSGYGSDSNYFLLKSSLAEVNTMVEQEKPDFALVLGDFLAHNYRREYILYSHDSSKAGFHNFVKKTFQFLTLELRQSIPGIDVYPAMGNNDAYEDYEVDPNGGLLHENAETWSVFFKDKNNKENFKRTFPSAGYYVVDVPTNEKQRIIVLNTVLFSTNVQGKHVKQAANRELSWLHEQLAQAAQEKYSVILAFHIPPGVDVYHTLQSFFGGIKGFWQTEYSDAFDKILREFPATVTAILPGHIHMDSFQLFTGNQQSEIPLSFTPSISPIFGNNPAFKIYSYDPATLRLKNYETYFYPLNETPAVWKKEYTFNQIYKAPCVNCNITNGMKTLKPHGGAANFFKQYYASGTDAQPITQDHYWMPYYWCDIYSVTAEIYQRCIRKR